MNKDVPFIFSMTLTQKFSPPNGPVSGHVCHLCIRMFSSFPHPGCELVQR